MAPFKIESGSFRLNDEQNVKLVKQKDTNLKIGYRNWITLSFFCLCSCSNVFQWVNLNVIGDITSNIYFGNSKPQSSVHNIAIDSLCIVYFVAYIIFSLPALFFLQKVGPRTYCIFGTFLNASGAEIKYASVASNSFSILMLGQALCGASSVFLLHGTAENISMWFSPNHKSTFRVIFAAVNLVGYCLGFVLPSLIILHDTGDRNDLQNKFNTFLLVNAMVTTVIFLLFYVSVRTVRIENDNLQIRQTSFVKCQEIIEKSNLLRFLIGLGLLQGSGLALGSLLNPIFLCPFSCTKDDVDASEVVSGLVCAGLSSAAGFWLNRRNPVYDFLLWIFPVISIMCITLILGHGIQWVMYVAFAFQSYCINSDLCVDVEDEKEEEGKDHVITLHVHPNMLIDIIAITLTLSLKTVAYILGVTYANISLCVFILFSLALTRDSQWDENKTF